MEMEAPHGTCREPTSFFLLGVALRSFFLVLATHLLAGEVDTTLACAPLTRRLSWWCRYYNPLNLSWRYYSMFAYRFTARTWGTHQLALINHEEHPFLPPVPYIVGETVHPLRVRRLEMAGLLSSQGILTFSAAYQGTLAIQYAISTEGIPYLPNMTVPLAMVGLFRVMASKWVATKIQVDAYPYPCMPVSPASQDVEARLRSHPLQKTDPSSTRLHTINSSKDPSSAYLPIIRSPEFLFSSSSSISKSHRQPCPSLMSTSITAFNTEPSPSSSPLSSESSSKSQVPSPMNLWSSQPSCLLLPSYPYTACPPSTLLHSPLRPQSCVSPSLPILSRPYCLLTSPRQAAGFLPFASERLGATELLPSVCSHRSHLLPLSNLSSDMSKESPHAVISSSTSLSTKSSTCSTPCGAYVSCTCPCGEMTSATPSVVRQAHPVSSTYSPPIDYKSNKFVVAGWIGILFALVIMSFLPYKVAAAYQLPRRLLQFSMQTFYQYIAVSEFAFHAYLLCKGPGALANRVLFFDHWTFKAQTVGFYCLLISMLLISLIDFVKNGFYRDCA